MSWSLLYFNSAEVVPRRVTSLVSGIVSPLGDIFRNQNRLTSVSTEARQTRDTSKKGTRHAAVLDTKCRCTDFSEF
jgi:hypothetical protein